MNRILDRFWQVARPNVGWYAMGAAVALTLLGVAAINTVDSNFATLQFQRWLPIALVAMLICAMVHPRLIEQAAYPTLIASTVLLLFLVLPFVPRWLVPRINGATSWINLGIMNFQPSEVTKIAFVLSLAWYLRYRDSYRTLWGLMVPFLIMFVPVALILKEPDLGQALLFAPALFAMLVAAGAKLRHLGALVGLGIAAIAINVVIILYAPPSMQILEPHQQMRIVSMISLARGSDRYNNDEAFQQHQAMMLVGAGGLTGYGKAQSQSLITLNRLPEPHNDMVYAVIANRWGLAGTWTLMGLYFILVLSFLLAAGKSKDPFARLACVGFAGMIFTQVTINVGMNIGLLPITGITLPFVSYGGSSLLSMFAMVGLMLNFASRRPTMLARPSFEFDQPHSAQFSPRLSSSIHGH